MPQAVYPLLTSLMIVFMTIWCLVDVAYQRAAKRSRRQNRQVVIYLSPSKINNLSIKTIKNNCYLSLSLSLSLIFFSFMSFSLCSNFPLPLLPRIIIFLRLTSTLNCFFLFFSCSEYFRKLNFFSLKN